MPENNSIHARSVTSSSDRIVVVVVIVMGVVVVEVAVGK